MTTGDVKDPPPSRELERADEEGSETEPASHDRSSKRAVVLAESYQSFQGPIPPPEWLRGYDEIEPGLASRIVAMAEDNQRHRHEQERTAVQHDVTFRSRGQVFGFVLGMFGLAGGFGLVALGHSVVGLVSFVGVLATLIWSAVWLRKSEPPAEPDPEPDKEGGRQERLPGVD